MRRARPSFIRLLLLCCFGVWRCQATSWYVQCTYGNVAAGDGPICNDSVGGHHGGCICLKRHWFCQTLCSTLGLLPEKNNQSYDVQNCRSPSCAGMQLFPAGTPPPHDAVLLLLNRTAGTTWNLCIHCSIPMYCSKWLSNGCHYECLPPGDTPEPLVWHHHRLHQMMCLAIQLQPLDL